MSKILVFTFPALAQRGGIGDLRNVLETDNREQRTLVDSSGFLLPEQLDELAGRTGAPSCIQALHLDQCGKPVRQESWQRVSPITSSPDDAEMLVCTSTGHKYLRLSAEVCRLGQL